MATKSDSEGFVSSPLEGQGVRRKDSYFLASEADEDQFQAADSEYRKVKADFERIARSRRQRRGGIPDLLRQMTIAPLGLNMYPMCKHNHLYQIHKDL